MQLLAGKQGFPSGIRNNGNCSSGVHCRFHTIHHHSYLHGISGVFTQLVQVVLLESVSEALSCTQWVLCHAHSGCSGDSSMVSHLVRGRRRMEICLNHNLQLPLHNICCTLWQVGTGVSEQRWVLGWRGAGGGGEAVAQEIRGTGVTTNIVHLVQMSASNVQNGTRMGSRIRF